MGGSIFIGRFLGIRVSIHWTFLLLLLYYFLTSSFGADGFRGGVWIVFLLLAVFLCVTLHEFGHALAARRYGINTRSIILLPIGGVANLEKIPEKPVQELVVSLAGPFVNFLIAAGVMLGFYVTGHMPEFSADHAPGDFTGAMEWLMVTNVGLMLFNLVPAFPMDGGRVFRALLAFRLGRLRATRVASLLGQGLAGLAVIYGLINGEFSFALAGAFIFLGAQSEYQQVKSESLLGGFKVGDIVMKEFTVFHPYQRLNEAVQKLLSGQEKNFLVIRDTQFEGVLTSRDIISGMAEHGQDEMIGRVVTKNVPVLDYNDTLNTALDVFRRSGVPFLPVLREGRLEGVLDLENVNEFLMIRSAGSK